MIEAEKQLFTILVITYNSEKYLVEALESAARQTYRNIELVISDDGSKDKTVCIAEEWASKNHSAFFRIKIIKASINTGIPSNINRGVLESKGNWIKILAGDDILTDSCIEKFSDAIKRNPGVNFFVGSKLVMKNGHVVEKISPSQRYLNLPIHDQLKNLLKAHHSHIPSVAALYNKHTFLEIGGMNENYKLMEDLPFEIKVLKNEMTFTFVDAPVVIYRVHDSGLSNASEKTPLNSCIKKFHDNEILPDMFENKMFFWYRHFTLNNKLTSSSGFKKLILSIFIRLTDPIYWYKKILWMLKNKMVTDVPYDIDRLGGVAHKPEI